MKYAVINTQTKRILKVRPDNIRPLEDGRSYESISNAKASTFESSDAPLFLIENELKTAKQKAALLNPEALKDNIRFERNNLLEKSDWTQMPDSPLSVESKSAWATYRQQLRDLPATMDENGEVTFPAKPTV